MDDKLVFREIRGFFDGPVIPEMWHWLENFEDENQVTAYPRRDIYLVVDDRDDIGLKVREGRFEIKTREDNGVVKTFNNGEIAGLVEDWKKQTWSG